MTSLIACLSTGKGTWLTVQELIDNHSWDQIILISNDFGKEKFKSEKAVEFITLHAEKPIKDIKGYIKSQLHGKIKDLEVAVNIDSGSGKEHMALISALIQLGFSIRFVTVEDKRLMEITPYEN